MYKYSAQVCQNVFKNLKIKNYDILTSWYFKHWKAKHLAKQIWSENIYAKKYISKFFVSKNNHHYLKSVIWDFIWNHWGNCFVLSLQSYTVIFCNIWSKNIWGGLLSIMQICLQMKSERVHIDFNLKLMYNDFAAVAKLKYWRNWRLYLLWWILFFKHWPLLVYASADVFFFTILVTCMLGLNVESCFIRYHIILLHLNLL